MTMGNMLFRLGAAAVLFAAADAAAQIGIGIKTDRTRYLQYEPVKVQVTLRNDTGNALIFPEDDQGKSYLRIRVDNREGMPVKTLQPGKANFAAGLVLGAGETKTLHLVVNDVADIQDEGVYQIFAEVGHDRLARDYRSETLIFQVSSGLPVWSREIGMPATDTTSRIAPRKVSLLLFQESDRYRFALQMEDDAKVYGIVRLGPRISGFPPQCDVDSYSNIHILTMARPRLVQYRIFDNSLVLKQDRYYVMLSDSIPKLQRDPAIGRVMVAGGREAVAGKDYIVDDLPKADDDAPAPAPVNENSGPAAVPRPAAASTSSAVEPVATPLEPADSTPSGKASGTR